MPVSNNRKSTDYQNIAKAKAETDYQNITNRNTKTNSRPFSRQHPGEKITTLKNQIEKQMKAYVKQEEYEEMLKLIKVNFFVY